MERDPSRERAAWRDVGPFERGRIDEAIARGDVLPPELLDATLHRTKQLRRHFITHAGVVTTAPVVLAVILWHWEPSEEPLGLLRWIGIIWCGQE